MMMRAKVDSLYTSRINNAIEASTYSTGKDIFVKTIFQRFQMSEGSRPRPPRQEPIITLPLWDRDFLSKNSHGRYWQRFFIYKIYLCGEGFIVPISSGLSGGDRGKAPTETEKML